MDSVLFDNRISKNTAQYLLDTGSYLVDLNRTKKEWFRWKSGVVAPCCCNCRYLNRSSSASRSVSQYLAEVVKDKYPHADLIVGLASAGIAWSSRVSSILNLPMAFVRSSPKKHGVGNLVDTGPVKGMKAVLIDDLCASGKSLTMAKNALTSEYGIETLGAVTIVNWMFDETQKHMIENGLAVHCLTSYKDILEMADENGIISNLHRGMLTEFYRNPRAYRWDRLVEAPIVCTR